MASPRSSCQAPLLVFLALLHGSTSSNVQIMVTSKVASFERRVTLRGVFKACFNQVAEGHRAEQLFFLGSPENDTSDDILTAIEREVQEYGDVVIVGGPNVDPWVARDVTYVLDRPTSRGYRLAYGTAWLAEHRPDLDYVMYLDDDSFLNLPRLFMHLELQDSTSLAMGFLMETMLDPSQTSICELCKPCEWCLQDRALTEFCSEFPDMSLGGCMSMMHQCNLFNEGQDMAVCVRQKHAESMRIVQYFGSLAAPRWFLGMGWVFGRRIVHYLAKNVDDLKKQGAADVQLGFWLAPLERVQWVDMKDGYFHDYPMPGNTFAQSCTERSVLVHRMNKDRWRNFDPATCTLECPLAEVPD